MRIVSWQKTLMKYHFLFLSKLGKMSQNLSSAAILVGALMINLSQRPEKGTSWHVHPSQNQISLHFCAVLNRHSVGSQVSINSPGGKLDSGQIERVRRLI